MWLSDVCICTADLPKIDNAAIQAGIESLGGMYRRELTKEVTHLLVLAKGSLKYDVGMQYGIPLGLKIVLPHWFEDCIKFRQKLPEEPYEFPSPPIFDIPAIVSTNLAENVANPHRNHSSPNKLIPIIPVPPFVQVSEAGRVGHDTIYQKTAVINRMEKEGPTLAIQPSASGISFGSLAPTESKPTPTKVFPPHVRLIAATAPIFAGRKVYLGGDLGIRSGLEEALKERIIEAGGECWSWNLDGRTVDKSRDQWDRRRVAEEILLSCNTIVMRTREGWEYWISHEGKKTIGNLAWLYHVLAISTLTSPLDRLLHYPLPATFPPGAEQLEITISNHVAAKRDYVRCLIECLGAHFTGSMSKTATHVVSANWVGDKVDFAQKWNKPIVSHFWVEACISEWRIVDIDFSPTFTPSLDGMDSTLEIGRTPLLVGAIERWCELPAVRVARTAALVPYPLPQPELPQPELPLAVEIGMELDMNPPEEERVGETLEETAMQSFGGGTSSREEAIRPVVKKEPKSPLKSALRKKATITSEVESLDLPSPSPKVTILTTKKSPVKKATIQIPEEEGDDEEEDEEDEEDQLDDETMDDATKSSPTDASTLKNESATKKGKGKGKEVTPTEATEDSMDVDQDPDTDDPSVIVEEIRQPKASTSKPIPKSPIQSKKKPEQSATPKGRANRVQPATSSSAIKLPSSGHRGIDPAAIIARGTKRSAANQANGKLKIQMTDKNVFDAQVRLDSGKKKLDSGKKSRNTFVDGESEEDELDESGSDISRERVKRKVEGKLSRKVLGGKMDGDGSGVISSFDASMKVKPIVKKKSAPKAQIYFIKTGLDLDSTSKELVELAKLGAVEADAKNPATVMIVKAFVRTKTFLLGLVDGPIVISDDWIKHSLQAKSLLDPQDYLLQDKVGEKKFGVKLADVLDRAREGKLFQDQTISITSACKNRAILDEIISAHGGIVTSKLPSLTEFSDSERFVVSGMEERKKWEHLAAKGCAVFTFEGVLMSTIRQLPLDQSNERCDPQIHG